MIEAITGQLGAGKTLMMVRNMIKERKKHEFKKKYLKSNKKLIQFANFPVDEEILPDVILLKNENIKQLYDWILHKKYFGASIYLDEASILFPALAWSNIPADVILALRQHRHAGYNLTYTAQDLDDVAKGLRNVTQFCTCVDGWSLLRFSLFCCYQVKRGKVNHRKKFNRGFYIHQEKYYKAYDTTHNIDKPEYLDSKPIEQDINEPIYLDTYV